MDNMLPHTNNGDNYSMFEEILNKIWKIKRRITEGNL